MHSLARKLLVFVAFASLAAGGFPAASDAQTAPLPGHGPTHLPGTHSADSDAPARAPTAIAPTLSAPAALDTGEIDDFIESVMEEFKVPGLAVAAIQDGEVVLSKGYGYRDVEKQLAVTDRTLFAIGSNSKSFTANILGQLVEEGLIEWDEPLRTYLPDFQLRDAWASREMTPRDLVIHDSGLPRHDLLWYGRSFTREELFERLRFLEPNASFRSEWQYQNLMFMTAGYLAERVTGKTWEELVAERIFRPLGMERSNFSVDDMARDPDASLPYMEIEDEVRAVPYRSLDAIGPAGSINSSVEEMLRYIEMNIGLGTYGETEIIAEATAKEMQRPQMAFGGDPQFPELGYSAYGLGLMVTTYRGRKHVTHGGGIDGFISHMSWMPEEKIGVMVLTNFSGFNPVPNMVAQRVYDELLGLEPVDWVGRVRKQREEFEMQQKKQEEEKKEKRVEGTSPSHDLSHYAGTYEHPGYGTVEIRMNGDGLEGTFDRFDFALDHYHFDVFQGDAGPGVPMNEMLVTFVYDDDGVVDRVLVPLEPNVDDIVFEKKEEKEEDEGM